MQLLSSPPQLPPPFSSAIYSSQLRPCTEWPIRLPCAPNPAQAVLISNQVATCLCLCLCLYRVRLCAQLIAFAPHQQIRSCHKSVASQTPSPSPPSPPTCSNEAKLLSIVCRAIAPVGNFVVCLVVVKEDVIALSSSPPPPSARGIVSKHASNFHLRCPSSKANWQKFCHRKSRRNWVKFVYRFLFDNNSFICLSQCVGQTYTFYCEKES